MQVAAEQNSRASELRSREYEPATKKSGKEGSGKNIQSVDRALAIIEVLSLSDSPLMLGEIATLADINLSTCHHLVKTLVNRGYVIYAGRSRGYALSSKLEALSQRSAREFNLVEFVRPSLLQLNADLREAVQMAVLCGSTLVTQIRLASQIPPHVESSDMAKIHAAHAVATGKAILAWLPEAELTRVVTDTGLAGFTESTITSFPALVEELRLVRRAGFAVSDREFHPDLVGYGAAIRDASGAVIGAIGVSIPSRRATDTYRGYIARAVTKCAKDLSGRMPAGCFV